MKSVYKPYLIWHDGNIGYDSTQINYTNMQTDESEKIIRTITFNETSKVDHRESSQEYQKTTPVEVTQPSFEATPIMTPEQVEIKSNIYLSSNSLVPHSVWNRTKLLVPWYGDLETGVNL